MFPAIGSLKPTESSAGLPRIHVHVGTIHALSKPPALPFSQGSPDSVSLAPCDFQEVTQDAVHSASLLLRQVLQRLVSKKQRHIIVHNRLPEDRAILASNSHVQPAQALPSLVILRRSCTC